jgi:hypothetical protein
LKVPSKTFGGSVTKAAYRNFYTLVAIRSKTMNDRTDELQRYQWGAMGMRQDNSQFGTMHYYRGFDVELLVTSQAAEIAELRAGNELLVASLERTPSQAAEIEQLRATLITIVHQSNDWSEAIHKELASLGIQVEPKEGGMTDKVHDVLARLRRQLEYPNNASTAIHPDFAAVARSDLSEVLALIADIKDD